MPASGEPLPARHCKCGVTAGTARQSSNPNYFAGTAGNFTSRQFAACRHASLERTPKEDDEDDKSVTVPLIRWLGHNVLLGKLRNGGALQPACAADVSAGEAGGGGAHDGALRALLQDGHDLNVLQMDVLYSELKVPAMVHATLLMPIGDALEMNVMYSEHNVPTTVYATLPQDTATVLPPVKTTALLPVTTALLPVSATVLLPLTGPPAKTATAPLPVKATVLLPVDNVTAAGGQRHRAAGGDQHAGRGVRGEHAGRGVRGEHAGRGVRGEHAGRGVRGEHAGRGVRGEHAGRAR
jgi:hypothetical protein